MSYLVCLDAGHGKDTKGKRSCDGSLLEYEFNRDIVSRIKKHLERHNIAVILTAPTDTDISLTRRCNISNSAKANIFVSIHANASGDGVHWHEGHGWEIYYSDGSEKGLKLAESIHKQSLSLGLTDRGVKSTKDFTVVVKPLAPSVLIEHFFYTNKDELAKCNTNDFREKFAIADAKGIIAYLGLQWIEEVKEPQTIYVVQVGSFSNKDNAIKLQTELISKGYKTVIKEIKE
jgi:N-acetylmuramoyl-L-alanine amidase